MKNDMGKLVTIDQLWIAARRDYHNFTVTPCARMVQDDNGTLIIELIRSSTDGHAISRCRHRTQVQLSAGKTYELTQLQFSMLDNEWVQVHVTLQLANKKVLSQHWIPSMLQHEMPSDIRESTAAS